MHIAIYNPDAELIALFISDANQAQPTQQQAAQDYYDRYCSPFCTMVAHPADTPVRNIPETLSE